MATSCSQPILDYLLSKSGFVFMLFLFIRNKILLPTACETLTLHGNMTSAKITHYIMQYFRFIFREFLSVRQ